MAIVNAWGVVLGRRDLGEADRMAVVYTESHGKLPVRFVGVNKPGRKLKALSEPFVWAEFRLYLSPRTDYGKAVGGRLISTFPEAREDFGRTVSALLCCELLDKITPDRSPNPDKYRLLCSALAVLSQGGSPWVPLAFGLRLVELAGFGLRASAPSDVAPGLWQALHESELAALADEPYAGAAAARLSELVFDHVESQTGRGLKTREFLRQLPAAVPSLC